VFTSQRSERLTEEGIYYWFRTLKAQGSRDQRAVIENLSFHDLRHDFAQRARAAGWLPEEVAYYLGQVTQQGMMALQTIVPLPPPYGSLDFWVKQKGAFPCILLLYTS